MTACEVCANSIKKLTSFELNFHDFAYLITQESMLHTPIEKHSSCQSSGFGNLGVCSIHTSSLSHLMARSTFPYPILRFANSLKRILTELPFTLPRIKCGLDHLQISAKLSSFISTARCFVRTRSLDLKIALLDG